MRYSPQWHLVEQLATRSLCCRCLIAPHCHFLCELPNVSCGIVKNMKSPSCKYRACFLWRGARSHTQHRPASAAGSQSQCEQLDQRHQPRAYESARCRLLDEDEKKRRRTYKGLPVIHCAAKLSVEIILCVFGLPELDLLVLGLGSPVLGRLKVALKAGCGLRWKAGHQYFSGWRCRFKCKQSSLVQPYSCHNVP